MFDSKKATGNGVSKKIHGRQVPRQTYTDREECFRELASER